MSIVEYYSDIKRNGIWGYIPTWADLETIMASVPGTKGKILKTPFMRGTGSIQLLEN